jgi:N-ethylmaleimide reductase
MTMRNPAEAATVFEPFVLGPLTLPNRVVMAPMTRARADPGEVIGEAGVEYYRQRASAGLIISEGAQVSHQGRGYVATPGIHNAAQVAGWRRVTDAVRDSGGRMFCQLWHVGRVSHPDLQEHGALPVAPSAVNANAMVFTGEGYKPSPVPQALETGEIAGVIEQFRHAAACAMEAGFDGIELHAAGGYLFDQFLRDGANRRADPYGGSVEARLRFTLEVVEAVTAVTGSGRTGIRIAPNATHNGIHDSDPERLFGALVSALNAWPLAYVHVIEASGPDPQQYFDLDILRRISRHPYIVSVNYDLARANDAIASGRADLVAFGRPYIANPDLVERFAAGIALSEADPAHYYGGGRRGYTDYPRATP